MARNIYGLDLGSYEIKVYDKKKDTIWKEKDALALTDKKEIFAVGDEAYEMYEKTPPFLDVVFPMKQGVISRFTDMQFSSAEPAEKRPPVCAGIRIRDRRSDRRNGSGKKGLL